jgi:hypothetical protein
MVPKYHVRTYGDEFLGPLQEILRSDGTFGHRQHLHLAWRYLQSGDLEQAEAWMGQAIRAVAEKHGTPENYHQTLTIAWTRLVAAHRCETAKTFGEFMDENPGLLDRRLPDRHYSPETLYGTPARMSWVEPDLCPFP